MNKRHAIVEDHDGSPMDGHEVLLWGNNAAWLCVNCGNLLGDRTADRDREVVCEQCGLEYLILRAEGDLSQSTGVRRQA